MQNLPSPGVREKFQKELKNYFYPWVGKNTNKTAKCSLHPSKKNNSKKIFPSPGVEI